MGLLRLLRRLFGSPPQASYIYIPPPWPDGRARARVQSVVLNGKQSLQNPPAEAAIVGRCWVVDGDTIDIGGTRIRLAGIDAPEMDHPYGKEAKFALIRLCQGEQVRAVFSGDLSHDRTVATCYLPDGRDLSAEMVKAGLAIDWPKFSKGRYRHLEPDGVRRRLWRCDARQKGRMPPTMPD